MSRHITTAALAAAALFCGCQPQQRLAQTDRAIIERQVEADFNANLAAAERLDLVALKACVDDRLKTGFIQAGVFYPTFDALADALLSALRLMANQEITVTEKRITVLADDVVLLTAHGRYVAITKLGPAIAGDFAWTFVYTHINGRWKVVHSHQSTPASR